MAISYGLTNPAAFKQGISVDSYPDLVKFYTNYPKDTSQSSAADQRHPQLFTSINNGIDFENESISSLNNSFYHINYGGNLYFNSTTGKLEALGHKSSDSGYDAYKATANWTSGDNVGINDWELSPYTVPYSTTNTPNKEICRSFNSVLSPGRYFCIKDGGGYAWNDNPLTTAEWTATSFNTSSVVYPSDGGFKHLCIDSQGSDNILVLFVTNNSNRYIRVNLYDPHTLTLKKDYTTIALNNTNRKLADYRYISVDYLPNVGFLIFYAYQSDPRFQVRILRTYSESTGERLASDQFVQDSHGSLNIGDSNNKIIANGCRGWYCPWTKEYFFLPNPYQVFWTKDGINWSSSNSTGLSSSTTCCGFLTDGINMVVSNSASTYMYSNDKGTTWNSGSTLSPDAFYLWGPNDRMVIPFKCTNNLFKAQPSVTLGYWLNDTDGQPTAHLQNFYTNDYIPVNSNTSYIFYGQNKNTKANTWNNRITWYDSNKNWISTEYDHLKGHIPALYTSPSNAAYARLSCRIESGVDVTQQMVNDCNWYFAKDSDFKPMKEFGDIVFN